MSTEKVKKISVQTPLGKLTAEIGGDPDYPEIFVYLKRENGVEIDLAAVSTNSNDDKLTAYLYEDTTRDSYTRSYTWHEEALQVEEDI